VVVTSLLLFLPFPELHVGVETVAVVPLFALGTKDVPPCLEQHADCGLTFPKPSQLFFTAKRQLIFQ
jgi:hypothetical protein